MEMLILALQVMLGVTLLWSGVVLFSVAKMMLTVRAMRGFNRRSDWLEGLAVLGIFLSTAWALIECKWIAADIGSVMASFIIAALFFLFYITERHVQNIRNVRELKRSLTKE